MILFNAKIIFLKISKVVGILTIWFLVSYLISHYLSSHGYGNQVEIFGLVFGGLFLLVIYLNSLTISIKLNKSILGIIKNNNIDLDKIIIIKEGKITVDENLLRSARLEINNALVESSSSDEDRSEINGKVDRIIWRYLRNKFGPIEGMHFMNTKL